MKDRLGVFITFDGPNGVGKTSLIDLVVANLRSEGFRVYLTKELTDSTLGKFIRANHRTYRGETLALLLAADRNDHVQHEILPALSNHDFVLSDRYIDSSLVFQRLDGVELSFIWALNGCFPKPALSISITANAETVHARLATRSILDRFEESHTREEETRCFLEAAQFLAEKGFNVKVFRNDGISLHDAAKTLTECCRNVQGHSSRE